MSAQDSPTPASTDAPATMPAAPVSNDASLEAPALSLTDFIDAQTLQEIQDGFTSVTRLHTTILDAHGNEITRPTNAQQRAESDELLNQLIVADTDADESNRYVAPIMIDNQRLGAIAIERELRPQVKKAERAALRKAAKAIGIPADQTDALIASVEQNIGPNRAAAIQFLYLLANHIARLCYQQYELNRRVEHLSALYKLSTDLAGQRDLRRLLDSAARSAAQVMKVKAASIRLLDADGKELINSAVYNLSDAYQQKGPILVEASELNQRALKGEVIYVKDMAQDPRIMYPEDAKREGLVSILSVGMIYKDQPVGVLRLYTGHERTFNQAERQLMQAMSQLLGAAILNARLDATRQESERMQRQLKLAADVQNRMIPAHMPHVPPFDVAARYVPSFELGGDFFDFIDLDGNLGVAVGDVVGKGVAASLLMASVRASLRAYAQDVYDLDEIISRVNIALTRDTLDNEFATLFYGVLDPTTLRFTYCNAGHEPPLLLRRGEFIRLDVGGMIVGIDASQSYDKGLIDLEPGDRLIIYTDGLTDAQNFSNEKFGRDRVFKAIRETAGKPTAQDTLNHLLWEMRRFVGMNRSTDDTTLVVIRVADQARHQR